MRKKIAVFAGGWGGEYLKEVMSGVKRAAKKADVDVFLFVNFSVHANNEMANVSEFNIFKLPDISDFDGIIMMANSFNMTEEVQFFEEKLKEITIPVVSIEYGLEGAVCVTTDNYAGMKELALHIIVEHGARNLVYIGGPREHMESNERLKALLDAAEENHITIPDENIMYGDWSKNPARELVAGWIDAHKGLPDAFVCANDITAVGVCEWLKEHDYRIPQDVIVTGYDCIQEAQEFFPRITSVNHEWSSMGGLAFDCLMDVMNGKENVEDAVLKTRFVAGESCGCEPDYKRHDTNAELGRDLAKTRMDWLKVDSHFRHIYLAVRKAEDATHLGYSFSYLFEHAHEIEGDGFAICLDPEFFHIEENDDNLRKSGYPEEFEVVCSLYKGALEDNGRKPLEQILFGKAQKSEAPELYIFLPVYNEDRTYGFAMLTGSESLMEENQLYIWTRHMNQDLEQVRRNIMIADLNRKLTHLSVTDVLTGVYNRAGCEQIAYPMIRDWQRMGGTGTIMIVDIDRMKSINDMFGHASGDLALRTVATVLKSELPEDWIISRFGGDEFLIGGKLSDPSMDLVAVEERLMDRLAQEVVSRQIEFRLSISIGSVRVIPGGESDVEKLLQMADESMYSVKNRHHQVMDGI